MTDKVQKIKDWISKEQDGLMDANGNFEYPEHEGAYHILCNLDAYIDSLQEELVSEELEEAAEKYFKELIEETECHFNAQMSYAEGYEDGRLNARHAFKAGAKWQKSKLPKWKKTINKSCWSGEIGVNPTKRKFEYEHYTINADKLFKVLEKED